MGCDEFPSGACPSLAPDTRQADDCELDSFLSAVSHDLRAPLRAVIGFSEILRDDYGTSLDEQGREYLCRLIAAGKRIGALLDDLMTLSRATRVDVMLETVNLSMLAHEIAADLRQASPDREVALTIAANLEAWGDRRILRTVLHSLMENAWKFTSGRQDAAVEVGRERTAEGAAFFVRDNGAGFDMARAVDLFVPFRRLHTETEFPGRGIGLALVQRLVRHQGGRVWAESKVGKGATFWFTLPPPPGVTGGGAL